MRIKCNTCEKKVSTEVPEKTNLRARITCLKCVENEKRCEEELAVLRSCRGPRP